MNCVRFRLSKAAASSISGAALLVMRASALELLIKRRFNISSNDDGHQRP